ncbi:hypothetical protein [Blastococcus sp. SYSU D01042]
MDFEWVLRAWLPAALAFLLSGFGWAAGPWPVPAPAPVVPPDLFAERPELPDCGRARLVVLQDRVTGAAADCFAAAVAAGRTAELVVLVHGVDSLPVPMYHRALPDGTGEVFVDNRPDSYRSVDWQHLVCPRAQVFPDVDDCEFRDL